MHVIISLLAIASGFIVMFGMLAGKRLNGWTEFFLATTVAIYARYARHLAGVWRRIYVVTAVSALYFNFFVLIVQSFQKVPALKTLAPTHTELPFALAQIVALLAFLVLGFLASIRFREQPARMALIRPRNIQTQAAIDQPQHATVHDNLSLALVQLRSHRDTAAPSCYSPAMFVSKTAFASLIKWSASLPGRSSGAIRRGSA